MATQAARAHAEELPARPRRRARPRATPRRRVASGVVWITLAAALLSGIVALNVAVLRLNLQLDDLRAKRTELRTENKKLRAQAAVGAVPETIRTEAYAHGYRAVDPSRVRYLDLERTER